MDFAKRQFCSEFLEDFSGPRTSLRISHPMIVFNGWAVGSEGGGEQNRLGNSVSKD